MRFFRADSVQSVPSSGMSFPMYVIDSLLVALDSGHKWKLDDDDIELAYRSLRVMNMNDYALRGCNELSAGQMQKVSLCRGLVRKSGILIIEEVSEKGRRRLVPLLSSFQSCCNLLVIGYLEIGMMSGE